MTSDRIRRFSYRSALWISVGVLLAATTWACSRIAAASATAASTYFVLIVALAALDGLASSLVFSLIAAGCLDYFFFEPRYSLAIAKMGDVVALLAFIIVSSIVATLVQRVRGLEGLQNRQLARQGFTHETFIYEGNQTITLRQTSEVNLAEAQKLSHTGSFGWHANSGQVFWSDEMFRIYGFDPGNKPTAEMALQRIHPDDLEHALDVLRNATKNRRGFDLQHRIVMPDASVKYLHIVGRVIKDGPDALEYVGAIMDMTERRRTEEELRRNEERYRYLFRYCPVPLFQIDTRQLIELFGKVFAQGITDFSAYLDNNPDFTRRVAEAHVIIDANQRAVEMFGARDATELFGPTTRIWGPNPESYRRALESRFRGDSVFQDEIKVQAIDGHLIDALVTLGRPDLVTLGRSDTVSHIGLNFIALVDITERVRAREAQRLNEQRYRYLFDYSPVALLQVNSQPRLTFLDELRSRGISNITAYMRENPDVLENFMDMDVIEDINQRTVQMFGARSASELRGSTARFWRRSPGAFLLALESRLRREATFQAEIEVDTLDDRVINVLVTVGRPDNPALSFLSFVDVTDRVRATEALQKLQAEFARAARISILGELVGSIAHEINQPLSAIITNGEVALRWLGRPVPNAAKAEQAAQRIVDNAKRTAEIISRIRTMAAGQAPQHMELSFHALIRESIEFLSHEINSNSIKISIEKPPSLPHLIGDQVQLQQVVVNLILNAIQAMVHAKVSRPTILIRIGLADEAVYCTFEDCGPGIDPRHLGSLFDSFFTTKDAGMGMGLPIAKSIVESHGGHLSVDNETPLGGARFTVVLPIEK
jgi:signal transduction histidine kinase